MPSLCSVGYPADLIGKSGEFLFCIIRNAADTWYPPRFCVLPTYRFLTAHVCAERPCDGNQGRRLSRLGLPYLPAYGDLPLFTFASNEVFYTVTVSTHVIDCLFDQ